MDKTLGLSTERSGVRIPDRGKWSLITIAVEARVNYPTYLINLNSLKLPSLLQRWYLIFKELSPYQGIPTWTLWTAPSLKLSSFLNRCYLIFKELSPYQGKTCKYYGLSKTDSKGFIPLHPPPWSSHRSWDNAPSPGWRRAAASNTQWRPAGSGIFFLSLLTFFNTLKKLNIILYFNI